MADSSFAPPPGPPPPKVPEGWKAIWNEQYKEWFYVNVYTKVSQWDKPTEPVYPPGESPDNDALPTYNHDEAKPVAAEKTGLSANNPYAMPAGHTAAATSSHDISEDEKLARKLQDEENAKAGLPPDRGASDGYYNQPGVAAGQPPQYGQQYGGPQYGSPPPQQQVYGQPYGQEQVRVDEKGKAKGGFLGKLLGKASGHKQSHGGYPPQQYYSGPPPGQYGYSPQQGFMGQGSHKPKKHGPGMGAVAGGAALGVGAGLIGGAVIADAVDDFGGDDGGFGGDDGGFGGDDGGGDFGGDGGGDFGGDF